MEGRHIDLVIVVACIGQDDPGLEVFEMPGGDGPDAAGGGDDDVGVGQGGVESSDVVTVGCASTSSLRCRWPWQQPFITAVMLGPRRTTLYGARGLPGQECGGASGTSQPRSGNRADQAYAGFFFFVFAD